MSTLTGPALQSLVQKSFISPVTCSFKVKRPGIKPETFCNEDRTCFPNQWLWKKVKGTKYVYLGEEAKGDKMVLCKYLKGCHVEEGNYFFSAAPERRVRSKVFKLYESRFQLNIRRHFLSCLIMEFPRGVSVGSSSLSRDLKLEMLWISWSKPGISLQWPLQLYDAKLQIWKI